MKLDAKTRNALPSHAFALPAARKYPIQDASHARNALARAAGAAKRGIISRAQLASIDAKARATLRGSAHSA